LRSDSSQSLASSDDSIDHSNPPLAKRFTISIGLAELETIRLEGTPS
jgi:hypothetical protein